MSAEIWAVLLPKGQVLHRFRPHRLDPSIYKSPCGQVANAMLMAIPASPEGAAMTDKCKRCARAA